MSLRADYAGAFDPELGLADLSRQILADLGREYLLSGHLQDRVGLPLVAARFGGDAYVQFSIEEWMGASPIYSKRMQEALGFVGNDVGTVFKNLQLEIGAPQQFMDFQFRLDSDKHGEFWLAHCGALMDVEPFGEERVKLMCHDIEDPTFDATAAATHPCMKMRPIHRPPRSPAGRHPHCRWEVFIGDDAEPYEQHPNLELVRGSRLASVSIDRPDSDAEPGGWTDYSGEFDPGFQLEDLSHRALVIVLQEVAIQSHLLARAFMLCVSQNLDEAAAVDLGRSQWTGIAALTAERLHRALGLEDDGIDSIAKVFQLHPCFQPRTYCDLRIEPAGDDALRLALRECVAFEEDDAFSWFATLEQGAHPAVDAIASTVNPRARCRGVGARSGERFAWEIKIDPSAEPSPAPKELALARISKGARFRFERRRNLRA